MGTKTRIILGAAVVTTHPAFAQKTDNNAVTAAQDAFGKSVGDQSIGIYSDTSVRGFSPIDAGNVRIEGLYFDLQGNLNSRLVSGSSVRVGISQQGYNFPAPTGVIDYDLAKPGGKLLTSLQVTQGPWKGVNAEIDLQVPIIGDRLGIAAGADRFHSGTQFGTIEDSASAAVSLRYAPRPGIEIIPFWSGTRDWSYEALPTIYTGGLTLPKRAPRNVFTGQPWAAYSGVQANYGVVARADPLGFDVRLGVFRSTYRVDTEAADLMFGTQADGSVRSRQIYLSAGDTGASTSGELRVAHSFTEGTRRHTFTASVRARSQNRTYGGDDFIDLGASRSDVPDVRPERVAVIGPKSHDRVTQTTFGFSYESKWLDVGELTAGIQKTNYRKTVLDPAPAPANPVLRDSPLLFSAAGAIYVTPQLAAYAGFTRGLEEAPVAPSNALNRNEAPPAIRTEQKDAGLRWKINKGLTAVAGVFDISKPYFNLSNQRFVQIGDVRHRGVEFSLAGKVAPGLTMVLGNLLIEQKRSNGQRPIGATTRKTILSLNYRLPKNPAWSFDYYFESTSSRTANATGTLRIPPRAIVNLGMRYRTKISDRPVLVRALVGNITNTFGWNVDVTGGFTPNGTRRFTLSVSTDI